MLFAQVNEKGKEELKAALANSQNAKWYRRLKIIDLSSQGNHVPQLSDWFDLSEATVRRYIKQYNSAGLKGLRAGQSSGRNAVIPLSKEDWEEVLARSPSQLEKLDSRARNWSQPLLQHYLLAYHGVEVTQGTISTTLRRQGVSWNRAKKK